LLRNLDRLKEFSAFTEAILCGVGDDALLHLVVEKTMMIFADAGACALLTAVDGQATVAAAVGLDAGEARAFVAPLDERIGGALGPLLALGPGDSLLCAPLLGHAGIVGILAVRLRAEEVAANAEGAPFLLSALADQASLALEFARYRRERDAAEAALKATQAELRRRADALAEADRRKDEFLSMLAHELRNPLAPVLYGVQTLHLQLPDDPTVRRVYELVERQVKQMSRLLDDLLDVARITSGKVELRWQLIRVDVALAQAAQAAQSTIEARGHALSVELPAEEVWLRADPDRLEQVLCNLLINAAKYTDPGGHIWLSAAREGETAVLRVRDTGLGISRDLLPHIFELFMQGPQTPERSRGGLGIGLTMVRRLLELHGGSIEARSAGPGQGSEFIVRMPLAAPPAPREGARVEHLDPTTSPRLRVLIVEDNLDMANALAMLMRLHGHAAEVVHDGHAALAAVRSHHPDVVLLDLGLPGLDGYEVARRIRADRDLKTPPLLVAMSGYGLAEDLRRSSAAGCDAHLVKPVQFAEIERVLAMRR